MHHQGVQHADLLLRSLRKAVNEDCRDAHVGVLFSGGLDSAVLARLASEVAEVRLYTIGLPGSADLTTAALSSSEMRLEWCPIELSHEEVIAALPPLSSILGTDDPLVLSFEVPLHVVAQKAVERLLLSGQGADELFGGYARYAGMEEEELRRNLDADLEGLLAVGSAREKRLAGHFGKEIRHPYLNHHVLEVAKGIPVAELVMEGERKLVLRRVASLLGLEKEAARPKKAAQYGSGVMKAMKTEARRRKVPLAKLVSSIKGETL